MKFLKILLLTFLLQLISTAVFAVPTELRSGSMGFRLSLGISVLVIYLVIYYVYRKRATQKLDLSSIRLNVYLIASWTIVTIANFLILGMLFETQVLRGAGGWFSGLEYFLWAFIIFCAASAILVLDLVIWCVKKQKIETAPKKLKTSRSIDVRAAGFVITGEVPDMGN